MGALCFLDVAGMGLAYLMYPGYLDHGEPSLAMISWRLLDGFPAYPGFDDPGRISNVYGPLTFLLHAISFYFAGPFVATGKALSIVAALLIPVLMFMDHRRHGFSVGAVAMIFGTAFVLFTLPISILNRPDSFIALLAVITVWAKNASLPGRPEWGKTILIGVCGGLAVGFKIHAGIFLAPVALFHCLDRENGLRPFFAVGAVGIFVALLPFALPVFPLADYLSWFGPLLGKQAPVNSYGKPFRYALLYLVPVLLLFALSRKQETVPSRLAERAYLGAYLVCLGAAIYVGSKPGGGIRYMFPFMPMTVDFILGHGRRVEKRSRLAWSAIGVFMAIMLAISLPTQKRFQRTLHWDEAQQVSREVRQIMAAYPGKTMEMGLGENDINYWRTYFKTLLVLNGNPYSLDSAVVMETSYLKIPLTNADLEMIRRCATDIWLIPKGERPFEMIGYYGVPVYDGAFKKVFVDSYTKSRSLKFFDIWACKK